MKIKASQKLLVSIPTTHAFYQCHIRTTVRKYPEMFNYVYCEAIENALKRIEEENVQGIAFTTAERGIAIQVSLV